MEYFQALNFNREPFSNSPDPGLFYESRQHLTALQQLEIAVRLKRGLNVVIGDVGTGKTTISRQLIQKLSTDNTIDYALILDPSFDTPDQFLWTILTSFAPESRLEKKESQLKENIKHLLFDKGVDQDRTLVLIIDEGQKIAPDCLELLRELLNYETNSQKLLQIVIFAQKEFESVIAPLDNFKDRINFSYALHPLGFSETKAMVKHRMAATKDANQPGSPFSWSAYFALYRYTGGYPRKIIHLCHHVLLSLIVSTKPKAGYFFIRACAARSGNPSRERIGILPVGLALLFLIMAAFFFNFQKLPLPGRSAKHTTVPGNPTAQVPQKPLAPQSHKAVLKTETRLPAFFDKKTIPQKQQAQQNLFYGSIQITRNTTLSKILEQVYGVFHPSYLDLLLRHNTHLENPDLLKIGMVLKLPSVDPFSGNWYPEGYCILISRSDTFETAYKILQDYSGKSVVFRLLPISNTSNSTFEYKIVVNRIFPTLKAAMQYKNRHNMLESAVCQQIADFFQDAKTRQRNPI